MQVTYSYEHLNIFLVNFSIKFISSVIISFHMMFVNYDTSKVHKIVDIVQDYTLIFSFTILL